MRLHEKGEFASARHDCVAALRLFEGSGYDLDLSNVLLEIAAIDHALGNYASSLEHARRALGILAPLRVQGLDVWRLRVKAQSAVGAAHVARGDYTMARTFFVRALSIAKRRLHAHEQVGPLNQLGILCKYTRRYPEAARAYQNAMSLVRSRDRHAKATLLHNLAGLAHARGRIAEAEVLARRGLAMRERLRGRSHLEVASDVAALAVIVDDAGQPDEALALYARALRAFERKLGPRHVEIGFNLANMAALHHARGDVRHAAPLYVRAMRILRATLGVRHPDVKRVQANASRAGC